MADNAYLAGLKLLGRRELSEMQLRARLAQRHYHDQDIDDAVRRLTEERALDDRRVASACARTEAGVRHRGRLRALRQIEALGISRDVAREAIREVFGEVDESALLERALDRKLRHGSDLADPRTVQRIHRYLIAQGFEPSKIAAIISQRRLKSSSLKP